jgi:hypothetical protein
MLAFECVAVKPPQSMTMLPMVIERQQYMGSVLGKSCLRGYYGPNANGDRDSTVLGVRD